MDWKYSLLIHFNTLEEARAAHSSGYRVRFDSQETLDAVNKEFGIKAELGKEYKFSDEKFFYQLHQFLCGGPSQIFRDDAWILYVLQDKDMISAFGKENLKEEKDKHEMFNSLENLEYVEKKEG